jgi:CheY-like chemotaxis protein
MKKKKILAVDDEAGLTRMLKRNLEATNRYDVRTENTSSAAIAAAAEFQPDLILMDVMMPGMDGYATMTAIRQMPEFESLPIIAVTARAMPSDREKSLAAGANDYVTKPVDTDELMACMERWLANA